MNQPAEKTRLVSKLGERLRRAALRIAPGAAADEALFEELETQLLQEDVGLEATRQLLEGLKARAREGRLRDSAALRAALTEDIATLLAPVARPLLTETPSPPFVIMAVGVNGVGKTTTIAKLAQRFQASGRKIMLAAGDTFRAAAVEQLQTWGARQNVPVIAQAQGADPAAVAHDAWLTARARGSDVLIVDTAGRLHTQGNLMEELKKIRRVLAKQDTAAPHECLLVLDAGTGQNALRQIEQFHAAVNVTGLAITKLDGTAKGGILIAAAARFGIPIRYLGIGEQADDLEEFNAREFAEALVGVSAETVT
ncbi:MAG: signal recognition particle-docking protein FtsY [Gammaproteobacteria bacterium]|nr:signal recognition particle-docking protein FtsY [Gammaproteobacteria bacterium]MBU6508899.1 signal recognition particle-docking protein FtsY [Gammaproteobacteria bacterium]MDE1983329.1 signal recognition particle-docking protein FtsY [Gammaproteobacteria bacterium]